jgi:hypothetical protein
MYKKCRHYYPYKIQWIFEGNSNNIFPTEHTEKFSYII